MLAGLQRGNLNTVTYLYVSLFHPHLFKRKSVLFFMQVNVNDNELAAEPSNQSVAHAQRKYFVDQVDA